MKNYFLILITFLLFPVYGFKLPPGNISPIGASELLYELQNKQQMEKVFTDIENGLASGSVTLLSQHFSSQNYLSLSNGISGYYSSNQTYYILQDLFKINKPVQFRFTNVVANKNPYATGILTYENRNRKETAQVFISLEYSGSQWTISQLTIR